MTRQQRQAMGQVDQQSGEMCPAIHAEGIYAKEEEEAATYVR
jgi:hypothetical protein